MLSFRAQSRFLPRLALAFLLAWAAIAGTVLLGTESYVARQRRLAVTEGLAFAEADVRAAEQYLLRTLAHVEGLHALARTRELLVARGEPGDAVTAIESHLAEVARARAGLVLQVAAIGADALLTYSTTDGWQPVDLADREHFRVHAMGEESGLHVSAPLVGRTSGRWSVQMSRAIYDTDGRFLGVSVVSLDPVALSRGLASLGSLPSARGELTTLFRDVDGAVLARTLDPETRIGQRLTNQSDGVHAALLRGDRSGSAHGRSLDGKEVLLAFRRVEGTSIVAVSAVETARILAAAGHAASTLRLAVAGLLLLLLALGVAAGLWAARRRAGITLAQLDETLTNLPFVVYRGAIGADGALSLLYVSPSVGDVTGWPRDPESWTPAAWAQRADAQARSSAGAFAARLRDAGAAEREYRMARPDGSTLLVVERARSLGRRYDGTLEIVGSLTDVSAAREVEAKAAAAAKLATLGEMAAGMAHELNQPLAAMLLAAENAQRAFRRGNGPGVEARHEIIIGEAERARDIIDHLRIFARGDEGTPIGAADPAAAVRGGLLLVRSALREAEVEVTVDLPEDLPEVRGRQVQLEQVLVNLLINARDSLMRLPPGGEGRRLGIAARQVAQGSVELCVRDNGGGVPPALLGRIFDPFFTTKPPGEGTGIGLSICHGIITSFGGTIACRNAGGGAEFTITLPAATERMPATDEPVPSIPA